MNETTVTTPNELEIRVERIFDAPRAHVFSVWTDPELIPEWWGDGTVVEEMDVRPGGTYRFRTAFGVVEGEFREVEPPERLVQTFQNHLQTLEFEDLGEQTKLTQTMRFETTEERDTTMQYGVEEGAKCGLRAHRRGAGEDRSVRPAPRPRAQRKADTLTRLRTEVDCWVASADELGNAHLVPLSYYWDGAALVLATPRSSPSATNLLRAGVARVGIGPTRDVVLVDGGVTEGVDDATADAHAEHTGFDARTESVDYVYLRVTPIEIRAWREANELPGRLLMRDGTWLDSA